MNLSSRKNHCNRNVLVATIKIDENLNIVNTKAAKKSMASNYIDLSAMMCCMSFEQKHKYACICYIHVLSPSRV